MAHEFSLNKNEDFVLKNFEIEEFSTDKNSLSNHIKLPFNPSNFKLNSLNSTNIKISNLTGSYNNSFVKSHNENFETVKRSKLSLCCKFIINVSFSPTP